MRSPQGEAWWRGEAASRLRGGFTPPPLALSARAVPLPIRDANGEENADYEKRAGGLLPRPFVRSGPTGAYSAAKVSGPRARLRRT